MSFDTCDQCQHHWDRHDVRVGDHLRCQCGCMWEQPKPPPPPAPPSTLRERIGEAIWAELERQHNSDTAFPPYIDRDDDCIDGHIDMTAIADAVIRDCQEEWRCTSCDGCQHCDPL